MKRSSQKAQRPSRQVISDPNWSLISRRVRVLLAYIVVVNFTNYVSQNWWWHLVADGSTQRRLIQNTYPFSALRFTFFIRLIRQFKELREQFRKSSKDCRLRFHPAHLGPTSEYQKSFPHRAWKTTRWKGTCRYVNYVCTNPSLHKAYICKMCAYAST